MILWLGHWKHILMHAWFIFLRIVKSQPEFRDTVFIQSFLAIRLPQGAFTLQYIVVPADTLQAIDSRCFNAELLIIWLPQFHRLCWHLIAFSRSYWPLLLNLIWMVHTKSDAWSLFEVDNLVVPRVKFSSQVESVLLNQIFPIVVKLFLFKYSFKNAVAADLVVFKDLIRYNSLHTFRWKMIQYLPIWIFVDMTVL